MLFAQSMLCSLTAILAIWHTSGFLNLRRISSIHVSALKTMSARKLPLFSEGSMLLLLCTSIVCVVSA